MENASKALLMAGGVMLTILVISVFLYVWTSFSEYQANLDRIKEVEELAKFNSQFTNYQRDDVQGYELLSLVNKVIDYNQRFSSAFGTSAAGNSAQYMPIKITIKLDENNSDYTNRNKFTGAIEVPAVAKSGYQDKKYQDILDNNWYATGKNERVYDRTTISLYDTKYRLFENGEYKE